MATQPHIEGIEMVGLKAEKNVTIRDRVVAFFCSPYLFMKELSDTFGLRFIVCHSFVVMLLIFHSFVVSLFPPLYSFVSPFFFS